jgi:hypothetical protein
VAAERTRWVPGQTGFAPDVHEPKQKNTTTKNGGTKMKLDKWTLGLAAVGAVSLASVARAEEKLTALQTALSSTTISGYVDTSAQWNFGTGNKYSPEYKFGGSTKADGFNLNVVQLTIAKPLDESDWAAGYRVDLWFGPDANVLNTASPLGGNQTYYPNRDFAIRQAYVALRAPVGNGIDFKIGVFDTIIGYESLESGNNPNYTRSYGHTIEPQTHTGILATYRFNDILSASVGIANTVGPSINARAFPTFFGSGSDTDGKKAESFKTYMGAIALTAPDSWGWAAGSTLYGGVVNGYNDVENTPGGGGTDFDENSTSWYVGATLATPVAGLKLGAAFDYFDLHNTSGSFDNAWAVAGYASYQATEKLSLHLRGEYIEDEAIGLFPTSDKSKVFAGTATVQYDLWKNVISRVEFRWDHSANGEDAFGGRTGGSPDRKNAYMLAANVIYKF